MIDLTDSQIRAMALEYWACNIETGDIIMSASECVKRGQLEKIKHLLPEQNELVNYLRMLALQELRRGKT